MELETLNIAIEPYQEVLDDNYAWLRDPNWPEVKDPKIISYLEKENNYAAQFFSQLTPLTKRLEEELFIESVFFKEDRILIGDYLYYSYSDGNYSTYCRSQVGSTEEEILLDEKELAKNHEYFKIGSTILKPDDNLLIYAIDTSGLERYTIYIKDLSSKELPPEMLEDCTDNIIYCKELGGFFYGKYNQFWHSDKIYFHSLNSDYNGDILIYQENDNRYQLDMYQSNSGKYIFINRYSTTGNEIYYLPLENIIQGNFELTLCQEQQENTICEINHIEDSFYLKTEGAESHIYKIPTREIERKEEIFPHNDKLSVVDFEIHKKGAVVQVNENGLYHFYIFSHHTNEWQKIEFPAPCYDAEIWSNSYYSNYITLHFSSLNNPGVIIEYDLEQGTIISELIDSDFKSDDYQVERIWAPSSDGEEVPISLIYKKDLFKADGSNPLYLYGYGAYGEREMPGFDPSIFPLVDRGFVYAISHVRGGGELGEKWHQAGTLLNKKHSFEDFIASAEYLSSHNYTSPGNIAIMGGSAGGMLIGAVINERPELFKAAVAHVPFVDVLNTMLDETLPLTIGEYPEWGNPQDPEYYEYIKSYSPYDNIKSQHYPNLYVTTGIKDPRVTYWEPAKWVAKLREANKENNNLIIFETNMAAGHAGSSDLFERIHEKAKEYSFILNNFNIVS